MGKESKTTSNTNSTSKSKIPGYIEDVSKQFAGQAAELGARDFTPYEDPRVADFSGDQQSAFQMVRDMISGAPNVLPEALDYARTYANAPAQNVTTERVVDEGGKLGAIQDYLNPYQGALDTAIRRITEAADKARLGLNARMTGAGAFGDARHGVEGSRLNQDYQTAVGDTAGDFMRNAYNDAFGLRTADLNRFYGADTANAGFDETALNRLLQGATGLLNFQGAGAGQGLQLASALLGTGGQQQAHGQAELDAQYQEFLREMGWDPQMLTTAASVLGGLPSSKTNTMKGTTTTAQPDNSLWQLAGTLAGAAAAPFTGGASLAAVGPMLGSIGSSVGSSGAAAPYAGNPYSLPWLA